MRKNRAWAVAAGCVMTLTVAAAVAPADDRATFFPKGTKDLALSGSYAAPIGGDDEHDHAVTASAGYYFADNHAINLAVTGHALHSGDDGWAVAGEAALLARWHFWTIGRWSVYLDGGCGLIYSDHQLPKSGDGTHWDFTPQVGLGATYQLRDNFYLMGGARYYHASNAGLQGGDRHPGANFIVSYAGLMWTF